MSKKTAGEAFRERFLAQYKSSRAVDAQSLELACQLLDEAESMQAQVEADGYMIKGSQGQLVVNPLIRELRQHRRAFIDIAKTLAPDAPRLAGQALAKRRWSKNGSQYRPRVADLAVEKATGIYIPDEQPATR